MSSTGRNEGWTVDEEVGEDEGRGGGCNGRAELEGPVVDEGLAVREA